MKSVFMWILWEAEPSMKSLQLNVKSLQVDPPAWCRMWHILKGVRNELQNR